MILTINKKRNTKTKQKNNPKLSTVQRPDHNEVGMTPEHLSQQLMDGQSKRYSA